MTTTAFTAISLALVTYPRRHRLGWAAAFLAWMMAAVVGGMEPGSASAAPIAMAAQHYDKATRDGWNLAIDITDEQINPVPNLANAANSREAFVTLSATATATGGAAPITDSSFITGYQLGCQTDVSSGLGIGGAGAVGASNSSLAGGLTGFVQTTIQPGVIVDIPMSSMALSPTGGRAMLDIDNLHVKADACGGAVTIRSYAYLRTSTDAARSQFAIYGDPLEI